MVEQNPWYARLVTLENLLVLVGVTLLLCSLGEVSFGTFAFHVAQDVPKVARLLLGATAAILVLAGATLQLYNANLWRSRLATIYFASSLLAIAVVGTALSHTANDSGEKSDIVESWNASQSGFETQIRTASVSAFHASRKLLLVCRRYDSTVPFERDVTIEKSFLFDINQLEPVQRLALNFTDVLSGKLHAGETVECAVCLLPSSTPRENVYKLEDVKRLGGQVRQIVGKDITDTTTAGRP